MENNIEKSEKEGAEVFKMIETNTECCCNCKGINTGGFAWIYCEIRRDNDDQFDGDCGETLGCNRFINNRF